MQHAAVAGLRHRVGHVHGLGRGGGFVQQRRVGQLQAIGGLLDTVADPSYFTAVGLMTLDMLLQPLGDSRQIADQSSAAVMGFLDGIMRRIKKR